MRDASHSAPRRSVCAPVQVQEFHQVLEPRLLLSLSPLGADFLAARPVDTWEPGTPGLAADSAGNVLSIWNSTGEAQGVFGQFYDSSSRAQSAVFQLIQPTAGMTITESVVAMDGAGDFAVAYLAGDGSAVEKLLIQRFTRTGVLAGSPLEVGSVDSVTFDLSDVGLAMDSLGNVLVAWDKADPSTGAGTVYAQRYSAAGGPLWAGEITIVSGMDLSPAVACDPAGAFMAVWSDSGIWYEKFSAAGVALSSAVSVASMPGSDPTVAAGKSGLYFIAWSQGDDGLQAISLPTEGPGIGPVQIVASTVSDGVSALAMTTNFTGQPVLAWHEQAASSAQVMLQRYNVSLSPLGPRVVVAGSSGLLAQGPRAAGNESGRSVIVWSSQIPNGLASVTGQVLAMVDDGSGSGKLTAVQLVKAAEGVSILAPAAAMNAAGTFVAVWVERDSAEDRVVYQMFNPSGSPAAPAVTIATDSAGTLSDPSAAYAPEGSFAFSWLKAVSETDHRIWAFWTDPVGHTVMSAKQLLGPETGIDFTRAQMVIQADGQPRVIWSEQEAATETTRILSRPFTPAGKLTGAAVTLASGSWLDVEMPALAIGADGTMLAAWRDGQQIVGLPLDATGVPAGSVATMWSQTGGNLIGDLAIAPDAAVEGQTKGWRVAWTAGVTLMDRRLTGDLAGGDAPELLLAQGHPIVTIGRRASVALADDGTGFVLWKLHQGSEVQLWQSVLDANGRPAGPARLLATMDVSATVQAAVAASAADGSSLVVWRVLDPSGGTVTLFAQRFDTSGKPTGSKSVVETALLGGQYSAGMPDADIDAAGNATLVWKDEASPQGAIIIRRLLADGTTGLNTEITAPEGMSLSNPAVGADNAGGFVVLWQQNAPGLVSSLFFQRYDGLGDAVGEPVLVQGATAPMSGADVGTDDAGKLAVVWTDGSASVDVAFYDSDNRRLGRPMVLVAGQALSQPSIGMSADGSFLVAWQATQGDVTTTFARRFATYTPPELVAPQILSVVVNDDPSLGVSSVETDPLGVQTITVTFSEPVKFSPEHVLVEVVDAVGALAQSVLTPTAVDGSGTSQMVIRFAPNTIGQCTVRITLDGDFYDDGSAIMDLSDNLLDGEPSAAGSGLGYLALTSDLPTGEGNEGGTAVFYVTGFDDVPPQILSVEVDSDPGLGLSSVQSRPQGLDTIKIHFSEPVTHVAGNLLVQTVASLGGAVLGEITPLSIDGEGTDTLTVHFVSGSIIDTVLKVTLLSDVETNSGIMDGRGNLLDGEAPAAGSGSGYLAAASDLPSGNATAGGTAAFYVAAQRPPHVTAVVVDDVPGLGLSGLQHDKDGVQTIAVHFDEPMQFTAGQVQVDVVDAVGSTTPLRAITPVSVEGSGTNLMLITFAAGDVFQNTIRVTLSGGMADLAGNPLDGDAHGGRTYLTDPSLDLPSGDGTPGGAASFYVTAFTDLVAPQVVSVVLNETPGLGLSSTDIRRGGIQTITVQFSEPVNFSSESVILQPVESIGGAPLAGAEPLTPLAITGSGTTIMTITFAPYAVRDTVLRVSLDGGGAIADLSSTGNALDGESRSGAYLAVAADLPSGDGAAGGTAMFYVAQQLPNASADFNGDGKVSGQDFLIWQANFPMMSGSTLATGDADGDGKTAGRDFLIWQERYRPMGVLPGDFNGDSKVNGQDFLIWQQNFPTMGGASLSDGDATGDGKVNGADFLIWQSHYNPPDLTAPRITSVMVNGTPGLGLSSIDASTTGIQTITIGFSEAVNFTQRDVLIQLADALGGSTLSSYEGEWAASGSGTNTMTIRFADGVLNSTLCVKLDGEMSDTSAIKDLSDNVLDGEAGSGGSYLADGAADLPSGNALAGGTATFYIANGDETAPQVTSVMVNDTPGLGLSSTDTSAGGIGTITVKFSEAVTFTDPDVRVQFADSIGGTTLTDLASAPILAGSGTDTLTIAFAPGSVVGKVLFITLDGDTAGDGSAITDLSGNILDGQSKSGSYLALTSDLPSGDGAAGGAALFFVANQPSAGLSGDFTGDGKVNGADFLAWQQNFPKTSGATLAEGDANGDGKVMGADFLAWQAGYRPL